MGIVTLKSYPNGINVVLNADATFEEINAEVARQFEKASSFFKNAKVALNFEGRELTTSEESVLIDTITQNSELDVVYLIGHDERYAHTFMKACEDFESDAESSKARIIRGNVKNNECIESVDSVVIVGDVYPGCKIITEGDIIVIGGLYGEAYAGAKGNSNSFVAAAEMNPEVLMIDQVAYNKKPHKWGFKPKYQFQIVHLNYGTMICDNISPELLRNLW